MLTLQLSLILFLDLTGLFLVMDTILVLWAIYAM